MTESRVLDILEEEMTRHRLLDFGWSYGIHHRKNQVGVCCSETRMIEISHKYAASNTEPLIREVVLHEIAHALVGCSHHHDEVWRQKFIEIGGGGKTHFYGFQASKTGEQQAINLGCDAR